jgi:hypothetical protein
MTPEQQAILDRLQKVLDPQTYETIKAILVAIWTGAFDAMGPGFVRYIINILMAWARQYGTWMALEIAEAVGLTGAVAEAGATGAAATATAGGAAAAGGGGAAAVIGLGALPPFLLLTGGLLLPGSKLGTPGLKSPWEAMFGDPCEDKFSQLSDDYVRLRHDIDGFSLSPDRKSTMALVGDASALLNACDKLVRDCPNSPHASAIRKMRADAEKARDEGLDWLAAH